MINQARLKELESKRLIRGNGKAPGSACVMQMVSYIANEPWSDHPECACPVLTRYAIALNDAFNDDHRQLLKPFIPLLVGTRVDNATQIARKRLMMWRSVTALYPVILDMWGLPDLAAELRSLKNTVQDMKTAELCLRENKEKIKAAYVYTYADADTDTYAYVYTYADAHTYAHAYADAHTYADALREKLAHVLIETLRMAIEVKE